MLISCYSPLSAVLLPQSDTDSVSSASTSDNDIPIIINPKPQPHWETFDDLDTQCPPPPPPREELQKPLETPEISLEQSTTPVNLLSESLGSNNPFGDFDYEASPDGPQIHSELIFNLTESNLDNGKARTGEMDQQGGPSPFESLHLGARPVSPFDDFSSSVAQALMTNSQTFEDPSAVNALINTSQDLSTVIEEDENNLILSNASALIETQSPELPQPLIPTTTTAATTQDITTDLIRSQAETNLHVRKGSAPGMSSAIASPYGYNRGSSNSPNFQMQASGIQGTHTQYSNPFYNYGYQHMTYSSKDLKRPAGPRSPKFAQDIPLSIPQVPLNYQKKRLPPPPKPQPYSRAQATQSGVNKDDPLLQRLSSIGEFNPFENILGNVGMEDYVKRNTNKETPLV